MISDVVSLETLEISILDALRLVRWPKCHFICGVHKMNLKVHTEDSAPVEARGELLKISKHYGFIPNLMGVLANSPAALKAYLSLGTLFSESTLSPVEQQVVLLTVSATNGCAYCVAAHSAMARMQRIPDDIVAGVRGGRPLADSRLEALRVLTSEIVAQRGWPSEDSVQHFLDAGFSRPQILEVILGVTMKTLSNYANHIVSTPVDPQFSQKDHSSLPAIP